MRRRSLVAVLVCSWGIAVSGAALAQTPLQSVDFYGIREVDPDAVRDAAGLVAGQPMTEAIDEIRARLLEVPGVADAAITPIQIPGATVIFVGVRETAVAALEFRPAPTGDVTLPAEVVAAYDRAMQHLVRAVQSGQAGEDHDEGHALSHYEPMREAELDLAAYSDEYFLELVDVLHHSSNAHHRAVAAKALAYVEDKGEVIPELEFAASDAASGVRNNAVRALSIMGEYVLAHPELELHVDPDPFLQLLGSLSWTDRNKGSAAVAALSESRDSELLLRLKEQCLDELEEMARWHSVGHAWFAAETLARLAGLSEEEISASFNKVGGDTQRRREWVAMLVARIETAG